MPCLAGMGTNVSIGYEHLHVLLRAACGEAAHAFAFGNSEEAWLGFDRLLPFFYLCIAPHPTHTGTFNNFKQHGPSGATSSAPGMLFPTHFIILHTTFLYMRLP